MHNKVEISEKIRQQLVIRNLQTQRLIEEMKLILQTYLDAKDLEGAWQASEDYAFVEKIEDGESIPE